MIHTKSELLEYLEADAKWYKSCQAKDIKSKLRRLLYTPPGCDNSVIWDYIYALRHSEYAINTNSRILKIYWWYKLRKLTYKLGYQIPPNVFDKGLTIFHWGSIIVNGKCKIGKNCILQPQITIGQKKEGEAPIIGDNCNICSGARIIGAITIGNNVTVAPNAIVTKSVPDNCVVGGINQIIKFKI